MTDATQPEPDDRRTIAELTELAGGLAHELRNPLSTMMVNLKLLSEDLQQTDDDDRETRRRALLKVEVIRREAERLQGLFDEFLRLTERSRLSLTPVNLNDVVARLATFLEPMAKSQSVELVVDASRVPPFGSADENQLGQALLNIALNALQAMPNGGTLRFFTEQTGDHSIISVSDTGTGIALQDQPRVMRPFFSTKADGTGLGLSITRRIIADHDGALTFDSRPGEGTTFTIRLPRCPTPDEGKTRADLGVREQTIEE